MVKELISKRQKLKNLHIFYPTYKPGKHSKVTSNDIIFDSNMTMTDNISQKLSLYFNLFPSKDINLSIPDHLVKQKYKKRVIINPTSSDQSRNWSKNKYIHLSKKLRNKGFDPIFCVSPSERPYWLDVLNKGFDLPLFLDLKSLSSYIYESSYFIGNESGLSHIASYFDIPSVVISNDEKRMKMWQPGWKTAKVVLPPKMVPNIKYFRIKEKYWQSFILVKKVFQTFCQLKHT
jgi:heptosyltransferase III